MASYILSKYGEQTLSLFRILSSFESFRAAAESGTLSQLLSMNLVSFEKFLREQHGVTIRERSGMGGYRLCVGNRSVGEYEDDHLSSVTGFLVRRLKEIFPEAASLTSSPLVQVVRGSRVSDIAAVDRQHVDRFLEAHTGDDAYAQASRAYANAVTSIDEGATVGPYLLADALHQILVLSREAVSGGEILPFCDPKDYEAAINGDLYPTSIRWDKPKGRIPDRRLEELETFYEGDNNYTFRVSDDKKEFVVSKAVTSLPELMGYPATPDWVRELTFDQFRGWDGAPAVEQQEPGAGFQAVAVAPGNGSGPQVGAVRDTACDNPPPEGTSEGVQHVLEWMMLDVTKLSPAEKEVCWYGFKGAYKYFDQTTPQAITRAFKEVKPGTYPDFEVIYIVAGQLRIIFRGMKPRLTDVQLGLMAGGCVVKRKTLFTFREGIWTKKPSAGDNYFPDDSDGGGTK